MTNRMDKPAVIILYHERPDSDFVNKVIGPFNNGYAAEAYVASELSADDIWEVAILVAP